MSASRRLQPAPEDRLTELAREVRSEHDAAERAFESAVQHARRCGELLIEAKLLCGHGNWLDWLAEVGVPSQSASVYMRVARKFPDPGNLPATIAEALEAADDRRRDDYRRRMQALSAEFDRVMEIPWQHRRPDRRVGPYITESGFLALMQERDPKWAWSWAVNEHLWVLEHLQVCEGQRGAKALADRLRRAADRIDAQLKQKTPTTGGSHGRRRQRPGLVEHDTRGPAA